MSSDTPTIDQMNEIIARFMGGELISDCSIIDDDRKRKYWQFEGSIVFADQLKYHKSWDALIPVIKRIKGMHLDILKQSYILDYMNAAGHMNSGYLSLDLGKAHEGVYQFLTWYNQNKNQ